jgi:hypothetical protein
MLQKSCLKEKTCEKVGKSECLRHLQKSSTYISRIFKTKRQQKKNLRKKKLCSQQHQYLVGTLSSTSSCIVVILVYQMGHSMVL